MNFDPYTLGWVAWVAFFAIEEGLAVFYSKRTEDTLSWHIWEWFGINDRDKGGWFKIRRIALLVGLAWLGTHLLGFPV